MDGCTELPAIVAGRNELDAGFDAIMGLETGGLGEIIPIMGLGAEFAKAIATLLTGNCCDIVREPGFPSRVAIICARS